MKRPAQRPAAVAVNPTADDADDQMPGLREDDEEKGPDPITAQWMGDDMELDEADEDGLAPDHPKGATDSVKRTVDDTTDGLGNSRPKKLRIHTLNHIETKRGLKTVEVNEDPEEEELIEQLKSTYQEFPLHLLAKGMKREHDKLKSFPANINVPTDHVPTEHKVLGTRWVNNWKGDEVRSRLVVQGCQQALDNTADICSTTFFTDYTVDTDKHSCCQRLDYVNW